jgi:Skp family chaperone for outer membrane proteins
MKFERLGWIVAAALAGAMIGMGFQGNAQKTGTVDLEKVFNESAYAKKQTEGLRNMGQARVGIVEFLRTYRTIKPDDATKFRDLSLKDAAASTANDKAEIERIKNQAQKDEQTYRALSTKDKPTQAEVTQIEELNRRKEATAALLEKWNGEFSTELQTRQESLRGETLQRVKDAVSQVAKDQGYSMVFVQNIAPYSANDITAEALKAMNNKK